MAKVMFLAFALVVLMVIQSEAYQMTRCQLVRELRKQKFPESKMRHWVCLVESESSRRTHVISPMNSNGSRDHGLFQINDKYWCSTTSTPGKDCNVTCANLRTDNITRASNCAKKIYQRHGFNAWYGWKKNCQGALPSISGC